MDPSIKVQALHLLRSEIEEIYAHYFKLEQHVNQMQVISKEIEAKQQHKIYSHQESRIFDEFKKQEGLLKQKLHVGPALDAVVHVLDYLTDTIKPE